VPNYAGLETQQYSQILQGIIDTLTPLPLPSRKRNAVGYERNRGGCKVWQEIYLWMLRELLGSLGGRGWPPPTLPAPGRSPHARDSTPQT